jgi:hypothetical protein
MPLSFKVLGFQRFKRLQQEGIVTVQVDVGIKGMKILEDWFVQLRMKGFC